MGAAASMGAAALGIYIYTRMVHIPSNKVGLYRTSDYISPRDMDILISAPKETDSCV